MLSSKNRNTSEIRGLALVCIVLCLATLCSASGAASEREEKERDIAATIARTKEVRSMTTFCTAAAQRVTLQAVDLDKQRGALEQQIVQVKADIEKEKLEAARVDEATRTLKEGNDRIAEANRLQERDLAVVVRKARESEEAARQAKLELDRVQRRRAAQDDEELEMMELAIATRLDRLRENRRQLDIEAARLRAIIKVVESDERAFHVWWRRALVFSIEWLADKVK
eukprot:m51a1_g9151 hypothetical protein (227) ;mRNA; r:103997-104677